MIGVRVALYGAVFFSSLSATFVRLSVSPPIVIAAWRMIFTVGLLLPLFVVRAVTNPTSAIPRSRNTALLLLLGGVFLALHFLLWFASLGMTSVAHATVLVTIHPVPVMVLSAVVLRERVSWRAAVAGLIALAGAIILATQHNDGATSLAGDLLAFSGALAVSVYFIVGRYARRGLDNTVYSTVVFAVAAVILTLGLVLSGEPLLPTSLREAGIFFLLALVCTVLGHSILNWTMKHIAATEVSLAILMEPVIATIMAAILFQEVPGLRSYMGGGIIIGALGWLMRGQSRTVKETFPKE